MNFLKFFVLIFYIFYLFFIQQTSNKSPFSRLPTDIQPVHYEIFLITNLENFTYVGKQNIYINVKNATKNVILNSLNIKIKSVTYKCPNKDNLYSESIEYNIVEETVTIRFGKELPLRKDGFLAFEFEGEINKKLHGFYRSTYTSNGTIKYAAVTQFAATDARRCFPCWDEPAIKATYEITLTAAEDLIAISNTPIKNLVKDTELGLVTTSFEKTPLMSTYLVAFMICDYDFIESHESNKTVRVYAPKDKISQGKFSLEVATKALHFFESYFNIPYPLSKLDLITVADFSFGAMENWGLITYREAILLFDFENSSTNKKEQGALTVAHEVAHQWFGNLVTMEWWTHLWLNEGYASFMQYLCIDSLYPDYNTWNHFFITKYFQAIELDALANTHPIEVPIGNPSEVTEIFDQISYNKGASIIRMIYTYIGDDDFRKGMHLYLSKHSYSNVKTEDLWAALEETSKKPIGYIMSTWTKLPGFPLISVIENNSSGSKNRSFTFSQERFFINGSPDKSEATWVVPITIISALNPNKILKEIILDEKTKTVEIEGLSKEIWININPGNVGFFRTLYSNDLLKLLMNAIYEQKLPAWDRLGLLDNLFATAQAGRASTVEFLSVLSKFKTESDYTVWSSIIHSLQKINNIFLNSTDINDKLKIFGRDILSEIYSKLGWTMIENESHLNKLLRNLVLSQMVAFENEKVINEAKHRFELHVSNQTILPADFRSIVYQAALSTRNAETLEKMLSLYRETDMSEEKNRILSSLGFVKDKNLLQKVLEFSMSEEVKTQDSFRVIQSVQRSYQGQLLAWQYFKDNWKTFVDRYQSGTLLTNIVEIVTKNIVDEEILEDVKTFFEKNPISGTERTVQQSIETIKLNLDWLKRDKELIQNFLNSQNY